MNTNVDTNLDVVLMAYIRQLAKAARPIVVKRHCDDWGSDRQIKAENEFFAALYSGLVGRIGVRAWDSFEEFCSRATCEERIDEGLRLAEAVLVKN